MIKINTFENIKNNTYVGNLSQTNSFQNTYYISKPIIDSVSFSGRKEKAQKYEIGLSSEELDRRSDAEHLITKTLLSPQSVEYTSLAKGNQQALAHLVKASMLLEQVFLRQDNVHNIPFFNEMTKKAKQGDVKAQKALSIFSGQKGIFAEDCEMLKITLLKGASEPLGKGFFPEDLGVDEFHSIIDKMLDEGKKEEVQALLNQRTMVVRDGKNLKAIDYTKFFKKEFTKAAVEIEKAAKTSTNKDFTEFLLLQAKALRENNPMSDAYADKKWAELQDTPLEFTIPREEYADELTPTLAKNKTLSEKLAKHGIEVFSKDSIGCRVGIVNQEGTQKLYKIKQYLPMLVNEMPYSDKYEQMISASSSDTKQNMVDADLVSTTGVCGKWRGGIVLAENLPNDDKLAIRILNGGRRNVYHRQIRNPYSMSEIQKRMQAILTPEQQQYYNDEADHWFTIGHENGHSFGPKTSQANLGRYKNIIEENKADMFSISMLNKLTKLGMYTEKEKKQYVVTFITNAFAKDLIARNKPPLKQAHRVRTVMQLNYMIKNGAVRVDETGAFHIDIEKTIKVAQKMLAEIIQIQLKNNFEEGEKFVLGNFDWSADIERVAINIRKINKILNGKLKAPLAEHLLRTLK